MHFFLLQSDSTLLVCCPPQGEQSFWQGPHECLHTVSLKTLFCLLSQGLTANKTKPLNFLLYTQRETQKHCMMLLQLTPVSEKSCFWQEASIRLYILIGGLQIQHFPLKWKFWNSTPFIYKVKILACYASKYVHQHLILSIWVFAQDEHVLGCGYLHSDFFRYQKEHQQLSQTLLSFPLSPSSKHNVHFGMEIRAVRQFSPFLC